MLKKVREVNSPKFVREWSDRNFVLWQVVVLCGPDGKRYTLAGAIDNLLQSLDNSMEIDELLSQKETPEKKKRVVEDSSSSEEEESSSEEEEEKENKKSDTKKKSSKRSKVGGSKGGRSKTQLYNAQGGTIPMLGGNPKAKACRNFRSGNCTTSKCWRSHEGKSSKKTKKSKKSTGQSSDSD